MKIEIILALLALLALAPALGAVELPKARPFVLINAKELAALRAELAHPGWKATLYAQTIHANADLWLKREIEIPSRGGHYHNFFCTDGNLLELPKDQKFAPGPYRCSVCGKLYSGEKYEDAVRNQVHSFLAHAAQDLALTAELDRNPQYAAKAAEILLKYADAYPGPHTNATTGGMIYQSLDESMWVIPLSQAYDLIHNQLPPDQRTKIEKFLRIVATGIQKCGTGGNWGSWHLSAVGVAGYAIGDPELVKWSTEHFQQQIRDQLGDDGLWPESVHCYHFFPLQAFVSFAEAATRAGVDLWHWQGKPGKSLVSMFTAPLGYAYPDLRLPAIHDGWYQAYLPPDLYELAYYRTGDPHYAWVVANGYKRGARPAGTASSDTDLLRNGRYAFLFGKEVPRDTPPPPHKSVNYPVLGISMLKSPDGNAMLSFGYGPFLGHGHPSKMAITLFADNKLWAADYGTPGYGSAILPWYKSTFSHNTVIVDGQNQHPTKENKAELWLGDSLLEGARSETKEAYPGVTYTRTVLRVGDYFILVDKLTSETEHTYDFYLHSEGILTVDNLQGDPRPTEPAIQWIENLTARDATQTLSARWEGATKGMALWLSGSAPITPITGECPAESGARKIPLLIARQTAKTAEFIAVLSPYRGKSTLEVERKPNQLILRHNNIEDTLTLPETGQKPTVERKP